MTLLRHIAMLLQLMLLSKAAQAVQEVRVGVLSFWPLDQFKIDQRFVRSIAIDKADRTVSRSVPLG